VGSPYIAGNYLSQAAAEDYARKTGKVVVPSPTGGFQVVDPQRPAEHEYTDPAQAAAALQPGEQTVPSGRTINGVPSYLNINKQPAGAPPLENPPAAHPQNPAPPAPAPPPPRQAAPPPPPPPPPPDTGAAPSAAAPPPAPAPEGAAPQPPPPPPHEVLRMRPDGTFEKAPPAPPVRVTPRAEAAPLAAPPKH